jgi:hypothetical protein
VWFADRGDQWPCDEVPPATFRNPVPIALMPPLFEDGASTAGVLTDAAPVCATGVVTASVARLTVVAVVEPPTIAEWKAAAVGATGLIALAGAVRLLISWLVIGVTLSILAPKPAGGAIMVVGGGVITGGVITGGGVTTVTGGVGVVTAPIVADPAEVVVMTGLVTTGPVIVAVVATVGPALDDELLPVSAIIWASDRRARGGAIVGPRDVPAGARTAPGAAPP